jgi:hypothetical protein
MLTASIIRAIIAQGSNSLQNFFLATPRPLHLNFAKLRKGRVAKLNTNKKFWKEPIRLLS